MTDAIRAQAAPGQPAADLAPIAARTWNPGDRTIAALFLLPTALLIAAVFVFPLGWSVYLSFTRYSAFQPSVPPIWVGLDNYAHLLSSDAIWTACITTGKYVCLAVGLEFLLGFGIALMLNRAFPGRGLLTTLMLLPMMLSPALAATFWKQILFDTQWGMLNFYLRQLGLVPPDWSASALVSLLSVVLVDVWQWTPFMLLISLAGLSAVPKYLYEAAAVDQASAWFTFRHITLPSIWPLLLIALIFRTMDAMRLFEYQLVVTGTSVATQTLAPTLYRMAFGQWQTGLSAAFACLVVILILGLTSIYVRSLVRATAR